jgi:hypothetical protein
VVDTPLHPRFMEGESHVEEHVMLTYIVPSGRWYERLHWSRGLVFLDLVRAEVWKISIEGRETRGFYSTIKCACGVNRQQN